MTGIRVPRGAALAAAVAAMFAFASAAQATTVTITTGDVLRVDFDVSGMTPAYDPNGISAFTFHERDLTDVSLSVLYAGSAASRTEFLKSPAGNKTSVGSGTLVFGGTPIYMQFFDVIGTLVIKDAEFVEFDNITGKFAVSVGTFTLNGLPFIATPLPATLPLFLTGVAGLIGLARRRPKTASPPPRLDWVPSPNCRPMRAATCSTSGA